MLVFCSVFSSFSSLFSDSVLGEIPIAWRMFNSPSTPSAALSSNPEKEKFSTVISLLSNP